MSATTLSPEIRPAGRPGHPAVQGWDFEQAAYTDLEGVTINSGPINGLSPVEAIERATRWLEEYKLGARASSYHLRDWIFSRHITGESHPDDPLSKVRLGTRA